MTTALEQAAAPDLAAYDVEVQVITTYRVPAQLAVSPEAALAAAQERLEAMTEPERDDAYLHGGVRERYVVFESRQESPGTEVPRLRVVQVG